MAPKIARWIYSPFILLCFCWCWFWFYFQLLCWYLIHSPLEFKNRNQSINICDCCNVLCMHSNVVILTVSSSIRLPATEMTTHYTGVCYTFTIYCELWIVNCELWNKTVTKENGERTIKLENSCVQRAECIYILRLRNNNTPSLCDNDPIAFGKIQHIVFIYKWGEFWALNTAHDISYDKSRV